MTSMDWSLRSCARHGHVTYAPQEPELVRGLTAETPVGTAWKCLRCGAFIPGPAFAHGPAADAPKIAQDRQIRDLLIIRFLAAERGIRGIFMLVAAFFIAQLRDSQQSLAEMITNDLPLLRPFANELGWNMDDSWIIKLITEIARVSPHTLNLLTIGLAIYAGVQIGEMYGLWNQKRWGEYLTVVATSAFIPIEIIEISHKVTFVRVGALVVNLLAVAWLLWSKHLFGLNGGVKAAHDDILRGRAAIQRAIEMTTTVPSA